MDERIVAPVAITVSELAGSTGLVLLVSDPVVRVSWMQFAGNHFLLTLAFWVLIAVGGFLLGPMVWRKRRKLSSKIKFLATIWLIGLFADNTLIINVAADLTSGAGWGAIPTSDLVMRSAVVSVSFWIVVLLWHLIDPRQKASIPPAEPRSN